MCRHLVVVMVVMALLVTLPAVAYGQQAGAAEAEAEQNDEPKLGLWMWKGPQTGNEHWVHVPENYDASRPTPILVMSHGIRSSGAGMMRGATCRGAVARGWIAVAPTWKFEGNRDLDSSKVADELIELMKQLVADYNIDRRLIVSSGFSGGGGVSIRSFTRFPDVYTVLASQSSNFFGVSTPASRQAGPDRRPVLVVWGENDHPLILNEGPRERDHFTRKGNPTDSYVVPGGRHQPFPQQTWAWLDAIAVSLRASDLAEALKLSVRLRGAGSEPRLAALLAPFQGGEAPQEKPIADDADPFVKQWHAKHNEKLEGLAENMEKAKELYDQALAEGRRQLAETGEKFTTDAKQDHIRWARQFAVRWSSVPELVAEVEAAFEKLHGEKLPELPRRR